jgi:ferrous iron transport protein B
VNRRHEEQSERARVERILLLGNLQSGKTSVFRRLSRDEISELGLPKSSSELNRAVLGQHAGGWRRLLERVPGPSGDAAPVEIVDTPGTATLFPQGEDEIVTRDALLDLRPDKILIVVDAKNLRRGLALMAHVAELGLPTVMALNMSDEAERYGISIDRGLLESRLGIEVVPTVANQGIGAERLRQALDRARVPERSAGLPAAFERALAALDELDWEHHRSGEERGGGLLSVRGIALSYLVGDGRVRELVDRSYPAEAVADIRRVADRLGRESPLGPDVVVTEALHRVADRLGGEVVTRYEVRVPALSKLGRLSHHPVWGGLVAAVVVAGMYLWVGKLGATLVVDMLAEHLFDGVLVPATERLVSYLPWAIVRELIVDPEFGLVPTGLFLAFGLVLPVLFFFYSAYNVLVESGYLPRLSILLDRVFRVFGLNGRGILPLTMGLSCVTMALISTRMLETRRERAIASFLLLLGTPCAPLLSMMLLILGDLPISAAVTVFGVIALQTTVAGVLARMVMRVRPSDFIQEIPPMRVPRARIVLLRTLRQTYWFMREAVPLFLAASAILFFVDRVGGLDALERLSRPVVGGLLGLPEQAVQVFIKTLIRRESGATELVQVSGAFDHLQLVVTLLVMTFLTPCVNALLVLVKEWGLSRAALLVGTVSIYAVLAGASLNLVCRLLGVTF